MGMHQGSALSPLLFVIVMEAISREFSIALPRELLYADDLVCVCCVMTCMKCIDSAYCADVGLSV